MIINLLYNKKYSAFQLSIANFLKLPYPELRFLVFKEVGAEICDNCGEAYFSIDTTKKFLELAEDAVKKGTEIEVVKL